MVAKSSNLRLLGGAWTALILAATASAQVPTTVQVHRAPSVSGIEIDGDLGEWREPAIEIASAAQAWDPTGSNDWRGEDDLSARIWVGCDRAQIYVAGEVRDDSFVGGGLDRLWHQQDAVEVFFDPRPRAERDVPSIEHMIQLFIMPFSTERRWGRIDWESNRPTGANLVGVHAATQTHANSYTFELVVPLANFPDATIRDLGFDIAIDDRDEESDRYQYMTATGRNPVRAQRTSCRLELSASHVAAPVKSDHGAMGWVVESGELFGIPLFAALFAWIGFRLSRRFSRRRAGLRVTANLLGVALFVVGLILPHWLVGLRRSHHDEQLRSVVGLLQDSLDDLGEGVLGSYGGEERDRAFAKLLDGGRISRERQYSYTNLRDIAGSDVTPAHHHTALDATVLPYGIPLGVGRVERFEFREPLALGHVNLTVSRPVEIPVFGEDVVVPSLTATLVDAASVSTQVVLEFTDEHSWFPAGRLASAGREVAMRTIELDRPIEAVVISESTDDGLELVGMTWASPDRIRELPLELGEPSLGGIETGLRGPWPRRAGIELGTGQTRTIELPEHADGAAFDRLWLFYCATYPGRPTLLRPGDTVCELRVWERGRNEARLIEFRHQESMFFELERQNQEPPETGEVRTALRWKDAQQEARVNFVRSLDLGAGVERLELRNVGQYPVRFRSIVFGREVRSVSLKKEGSPLLRDETGREFLDPQFLERLHDAHVAVYRGERRTASTADEAATTAPLDLPSDVERVALDEPFYERASAGDGSMAYRAFSLLGGDWGGAVLGVQVRDLAASEHSRWVHRLGVVIALCAVPVILLLFGSALSALGNLRLRLIVAVAVVMLVPLGILSFVLIDVLEGAYDDETRTRLEQTAATARATLDDESEALRTSSNAWVQDLAGQFLATSGEAASDAVIRSTLVSQRPPAWGEDGGFLLFEFHPDPAVSAVATARRVFVGPDDLRELDTPLRTDPGLYVAWSVVILGVRADVELPGGTCSLSVGRRLDTRFLDSITPERGDVLLCGMNGYSLDLEEGARSRVDPAAVAARADAALDAQAMGEPVVRFLEREEEPWIAMYDVLRDLQGTPRALIGILERYDGATLPLSIGRVPVREFFVTAAGLLILASLFLGWVMTTRISQPIEDLERGARELIRGDFDVHIESRERGQIGRLTRTFNQMSDELRGRIEDLHVLNRGIRDLTSRLQPAEVITHALAFYARNTPADHVRVFLRDRVRPIVECFGGQEVVEIDVDDPSVRGLLAMSGATSMRFGTHSSEAFAALLPSAQSALVLPLAIAGRTHGVVLLLFQQPTPPQLNLELHGAMAVQITAAIENAWLYRTAVEDLHTGAFRPEYFSNRVAHAVGEAQRRGGTVGLVAVRLTDGMAIAQALGQARHGRFLGRVFAVIRQSLGSDALLCRVADDEMRVMVEDASRDDLAGALAAVERRIQAEDFELPDAVQSIRFVSACAIYPDDAASSEFLFDALAQGLAGGRPVPAATSSRLRRTPVGGALIDSPAMEPVYRTLERFAPTDISLLLEGETGVGKEMLTDLVHAWSKRAARPLVKVHCAALPESLLQSELFGHEKGAFTGAHDRSIGRFEQADGGTIFLDEIGEISLDVQVQLLRVLQERQIERVGGGKPIPVDVRVIAATNRNLREMVAAGRFREDLYYRLQGMVVVVPPLRERRSEIPQLIEHFRTEAVAAGQTTVRGFAPDAMDELFRRDWPGNIRELRNTVLRALVLANGELVTRRDLDGGFAEPALTDPAPNRTAAVPTEPSATLPEVEIPRPEADPGAVRIARLFDLLAERDSISSSEYAEVAGISPRTALRDLNRLQSEGRLERVGKRRGARYRLANSVGLG